MPSSTKGQSGRAGRSLVLRLWIAVGAGIEWIRVDLSRVARRPQSFWEPSTANSCWLSRLEVAGTRGV